MRKLKQRRDSEAVVADARAINPIGLAASRKVGSGRKNRVQVGSQQDARPRTAAPPAAVDISDLIPAHLRQANRAHAIMDGLSSPFLTERRRRNLLNIQRRLLDLRRISDER